MASQRKIRRNQTQTQTTQPDITRVQVHRADDTVVTNNANNTNDTGDKHQNEPMDVNNNVCVRNDSSVNDENNIPANLHNNIETMNDKCANNMTIGDKTTQPNRIPTNPNTNYIPLNAKNTTHILMNANITNNTQVNANNIKNNTQVNANNITNNTPVNVNNNTINLANATATNVNNNENARRRVLEVDSDDLPLDFRYAVIGEDGRRYKKDSRVYLHKSSKKGSQQVISGKLLHTMAVDHGDRHQEYQIVTRSRNLLKGRVSPRIDPNSGTVFALTASEADLTTTRPVVNSRKGLSSDTKLAGANTPVSTTETSTDAVVKECPRNVAFGNSNGSEIMDYSETRTNQSAGSLQTMYGLTESERDLQIATLHSQAEYARQLQRQELKEADYQRNIYDMYNRSYDVTSGEDVEFLSEDVGSMEVKSDGSVSPVKIVVNECQDNRHDD